MNQLCEKHIYAVLIILLNFSCSALFAQEQDNVLVLDARELHIDSLQNARYHHYKINGILEQSALNLFQQAVGGRANSFIYSIDLSDAVIKDSISFSYAFCYYSALDTISFPKEGKEYITNMRRTFMGTRVRNLDLKGCTNIRDIADICRSAPKVQRVDLSDCSKIEDMTLSFLSASSLTKVIFPASAPRLSQLIHAFYGTKVTNIKLPEIVSEDCNMSHGFVACSRLQSITLPLNLTRLYDGMFHSCPQLIEIVYAGENLLQSDLHQFYSSASKEKSTTNPNNITLWVKADNLKYYMTDAAWGQMRNILPISSSGINNSGDQLPFSISFNSGNIEVHSEIESEVQIHSISGRLLHRQSLKRGSNTIEGLSSGIYILTIRAENNQTKYITKLTL